MSFAINLKMLTRTLGFQSQHATIIPFVDKIVGKVYAARKNIETLGREDVNRIHIDVYNCMRQVREVRSAMELPQLSAYKTKFTEDSYDKYDTNIKRRTLEDLIKRCEDVQFAVKQPLAVFQIDTTLKQLFAIMMIVSDFKFTLPAEEVAVDDMLMSDFDKFDERRDDKFKRRMFKRLFD